MRILITGAAGNLGGFLARFLLDSPHQLRLMIHRTDVGSELRAAGNVEVIRADLSDRSTLAGVCTEVDCIVHFAGVLFEPRPAHFLPLTNVVFVKNLLQQALEAGVGKFVLVSFPHVEGDTTPEHPASGRLNRVPASVHAQTRLQAEREILTQSEDSEMTPVIMRSGTLYGEGVLMLEAARWLMKRRMLPIWRKPTWYHWLALPDFLTCMRTAIESENVNGIYQLGDDLPLTIQDGLDRFADHWKTPRPLRLPGWTFYFAATVIEAFALVTGKPSPPHRDFIRIGMISHVGDTTRMKEDLLHDLAYPTLDHGLALL
jgi:nucleoside-diphosphate-sugar epimerase